MTHLTLDQAKTLGKLGYPLGAVDSYQYDETSGQYELYPANLSNGKLDPKYPCPNLEQLIEWLQKDLTKDVSVIRIDIGKPMTTVRLLLLTPVGKGGVIQETEHVRVDAVEPLEAVYNLACAVKGDNHE